MRIALVILDADPARGGAERYTIDLAEALAKRGHEVALICAAFTAQQSVTSYTSDAPYTRVKLQAGGITRTQSYRRFLDSLDCYLELQAFDVVHAMLPVRRCDVYHPHAGMAAEQMAKANRLFNPRRRAMAEVERSLITGESPPVVIALSQYVERSILRHYPTLSSRLATLFNAVDLDRFSPKANKLYHESSTTALMIANDFQRKGLPSTVAALAKLRDPRLRLKVVGKEDARQYQEMADRLNVGGSIDFLGATTDAPAQYASADFFVLPTRHDPCSLVVLEALAMGLPVISTVYNGATEIMTDGVHGYVLPDPNDVAALADAMRKMLDPQRRAQMSRACLELRPQLSYDSHVDRLLQIYESARRK